MDCEKHKKTIEKYEGTLQELAEDIGDLHYRELAKFLSHLNMKIYSDGCKDFGRGREKLSKQLTKASTHLSNSSGNIYKAWKISEPYMEE